MYTFCKVSILNNNYTIGQVIINMHVIILLVQGLKVQKSNLKIKIYLQTLCTVNNLLIFKIFHLYITVYIKFRLFAKL